MELLNASGEPYFGTSGSGCGESFDGEWVQIKRFETLSLSVEVDLGGTGLTGLLYLEYTADPSKGHGISRVILPNGCLHTNASGVALQSDRSAISLAAVADAAAFSVMLGKPAGGWYRWRWTYSSGGSSPNKMFGYFEGKEG